jgi:hypothetical protein
MSMKTPSLHEPHPQTQTPIEIIRRRAQIRNALSDLFVREKTSAKDRVWIKWFLSHMSMIERAHPRTTKAGVMKSGRYAVLWIYEPTAAPVGRCPTITVDWYERFRPQL